MRLTSSFYATALADVASAATQQPDTEDPAIAEAADNLRTGRNIVEHVHDSNADLILPRHDTNQTHPPWPLIQPRLVAESYCSRSPCDEALPSSAMLFSA